MAKNKKSNKQPDAENILGKRKSQPEPVLEAEPLGEEPIEEELAVPVQKKRKNGKKSKAQAAVPAAEPAAEEQGQDLVQPTFRSKEKILLLTSRGISPR